jgi:hypothetical protein
LDDPKDARDNANDLNCGSHCFCKRTSA